MFIEVIPSSGSKYSQYGYTDKNAYVEFDKTIYGLDEGDSITVKATFVENGKYNTDLIDYDTAKSLASYNEKDGYTYYWGVYLQIDI